MGESVVVTGASGQLGQYMIKYVQDNHPEIEVIAAVRHRSSENQSYIFNREIEFAQIDLCDPVSTDTLIDKYRPTYFINTAANAFVGDSWLQPRAHIEYNTIGVLNQLEAIRKFSPSTRYFNMGTSEEFGCSTNDGRTQNESTLIGPKSPYGVSKAAARYLVNTYRDSYNLFAIQGWTFNFESPIRSPKYVTRKVTSGIARALYSEDKSPVRLGNLDSFRSWQYAGDVADGVWKMITNGQPKPYVLSSNQTHSIRQLVESAVYFGCGKIGQWYGSGLDEKYSLDGQDLVVIDSAYFRPNDVTYLNGDSSLIRAELGWAPKVDFNGLIKMMIKSDINSYT